MADLRASGLGGVPKGTTADRPASPSMGDVFYNGDLGCLEIYTSAGWVASSAPAPIPLNIVATNQGSGRAYNNGQASVVFSAGSGGGLTTEYIVTPSPSTSPATFTGSSSPITVTGLQSSQQYTYTVQARNNFGTSLSSAVSAAITATTVPQAPTIGTATPSSESASLTFTAPASDGGSSITNYKYSIDGTNYIALSPATTSSPITISGLTNGTTYSFTLKAVNANGDSAASSSSNSVTPPGTLTVNHLVIAGGGGGGGSMAGGGGGGGYRTSIGSTALTLDKGTTYVVTVGGGGAGGSGTNNGVKGSDSVFSTITSTGGGFGGGNQGQGGSGGSGGGSGGLGNTPSTSPAQGYNAGTGGGHQQGGGGGAGGVGANGSLNGANGGSGATSSISGSSLTYAGGGGGSTYWADGGTQGPGNGGSGGGGRSGYGQSLINGVSGTDGLGGGGGGGAYANGNHGTGGNGGSGRVIISSSLLATSTTGSPSYSTSGGNHIYQFTTSGSITF